MKINALLPCFLRTNELIAFDWYKKDPPKLWTLMRDKLPGLKYEIKMKKVYHIFLGLLILFSACTKKNEKVTPVDPPLLMSSNPANQKQDVPNGLKEITLQFNQKVTVVLPSNVTLNGGLITNLTIGAGGELKMILPPLQPATTYTLVVPANTIKGATGVLFPTEIQLVFSTSGLNAETLPAMPTGGPDNGTYDKPGRYQAGSVSTVNFYSSVAGKNVDMLVYTPPGYSTGQKYGVIYCYQGLGDKATSVFNGAWVSAGIISDNLLGDGKISKGVIIVAVDDQFNGNYSNVQDMTITDAIPYIDSHYSTYADADHRGLFGFSWGGGYTFNVGCKNLDSFHYISPSSAAPNKEGDNALFPNGGADAKKALKCLFISWAQNDYQGFIDANQATVNYCKNNSIPYHSWVAQGQWHNGGTWRPAMWNFLQLADRA
ncbi:MAG: Ig-like domain-containing protein, partial [Ferruginibacter sp.]